jgi:methyl-galactoside transport system ATP-binding protein
MSNKILLEMKNITKSFPGVRALDGVSLSVKAGTVHALMGENGAGKSTLMKCLFGVYEKDSGQILLDGKEVNFKNSRDALEGGVAMVHQELNQAMRRSVSDNMWLGRYPRIAPWLPIVDERRARHLTDEIFERLSISVNPKAKVQDLSVSVRQMLEIAKAISYGARVIVFDEPTSSLNGEEAEKLFSIIMALRAEGCAIIYISHKMEEILRISDEVTVMRDGRHVATRSSAELTTEEIIRLMVGRELDKRYPEKKSIIGETLLEVDELSGKYNKLSRVSFKLRRGEILGVAGLDGAGRTELLEALFGLCERKSGIIRMLGSEIKNDNPGEAIKNGFALITEERRATGIFGILSVRANTVISSLSRHGRGPFVSEKRSSESTRRYIRALHVKTPGEMAKMRSLSGGNQQKVIFARWLLTEPRVLLLDEPTRGVDVGAKYEIYQLILKLAEQGCGVIMVSSEMPELIGLSDRIIVMSGGKIAGEVGGGASQEEIMTLATKYV